MQTVFEDLEKKFYPNQQWTGQAFDLRTGVALIVQYNQLAALLGGTSVQTHSRHSSSEDVSSIEMDQVAGPSAEHIPTEPSGPGEPSARVEDSATPKRKRIENE